MLVRKNRSWRIGEEGKMEEMKERGKEWKEGRVSEKEEIVDERKKRRKNEDRWQ